MAEHFTTLDLPGDKIRLWQATITAEPLVQGGMPFLPGLTVWRADTPLGPPGTRLDPGEALELLFYLREFENPMRDLAVSLRSRPGKLFTLGYRARGARERLEGFRRTWWTLLVDIRHFAGSRKSPEWSGKRLKEKWGSQYRRVRELGNKNHADRRLPIALNNPDVGLLRVAQWLLAGWDVVLLCACENEESCHRTLVQHEIDLIIQQALERQQEWEPVP